ncbi:hypothetical protein YIM73052_21190 [Thermus antranikianii]
MVWYMLGALFRPPQTEAQSQAWPEADQQALHMATLRVLSPREVIVEGRVTLVGDTSTPIEWVPISQIVPNATPPRAHYNWEVIERFRDSILRNGLIHPLVVYRRLTLVNPPFVLLDGHYRYYALQRIAEKREGGGDLKVPVLVVTGMAQFNALGIRFTADSGLVVPHSDLDRALQIDALLSMADVPLGVFVAVLREILSAKSKGNQHDLVPNALTLRLLGVFGLKPSKAVYYLGTFLEEPALYELAKARLVGDPVFRVLAQRRVRAHPLFSTFLERAKWGIPDEKAFAREVRAIVAPDTPAARKESVYRGLRRLAKRAGGWKRLAELLDDWLRALPPEEVK